MKNLEQTLHEATNKIKELEKSLNEKSSALDQTLSEKNLLFSQLIETSKKALIGEMAGCIIHDINNAVATIMGRNMQIRMMLEADKLKKESGLKFSGDIGNSSDRIVKTMNSLRTFCDTEYASLQAISVKDFITSTLGIFGPRIRACGVDLKVKEIDENQLVVCSPLEIAEVFISLMSDSLQAVRDNDEKWIEISSEEVENFIQITITDNRKNTLSDKIIATSFLPSHSSENHSNNQEWNLYLAKVLIEKNNGLLEVRTINGNSQIAIHLTKA